VKRYLRFPAALFVYLLVALEVGLLWGATAADEKPTVAAVAIDNFSFTPKEITVAKGTTVTWTNQDDVPHTVVSTEQKFRSKALDTEDQFSFTFGEAGTYVYFCSVHPVMMGKVIVK